MLCLLPTACVTFQGLRICLGTKHKPHALSIVRDPKLITVLDTLEN